MIIEYIRYRIDDASRRDAFEAGYEKGGQSLRASPHCLRFEIARCEEDPAWYIVRIEWDSIEGHMQGFRRSAEFRSFHQWVAPFVGDIEEMRHYRPTNER